MFHQTRVFGARTLLALAAGLSMSVLGFAADPASPGAGNAQSSRPNCDDGRQDRAACLREAGAAKQEQRRDGLTDPSAKQEQQNAQARCDGQAPAASADCESRMKGAANSKAEGSVAGGGIVRETITPASASR